MQAFRTAVEAGDVNAALDCLAEDVRFRSPAVFKPYEGREPVAALLRHVFEVFEDFTYTDELSSGNRSVLFFAARVGDRQLEGVDDITVDESGKITDLRVLVRPLSGLIALAEAMSARIGNG